MSDTALARSTDPVESHLAAGRTSASDLCAAVVACLVRFGPMTTKEISDRTGLSRVSVSPRMKPLLQEGRVARTGDRRDGSAVWRALPPITPP